MDTKVSTNGTTSASGPKPAPPQGRRNKPPKDAEERTQTRAKGKPQMPLAQIIAYQQWEHDRAFIASIAAGRERGFKSLDEYTTQRQAWQARIDRRKEIVQGERSQGLAYSLRRTIRISGAMLKLIAPPAAVVIFLWQMPHIFHSEHSVFGKAKAAPIAALPAAEPAFTALWFAHALPSIMATFGVLMLFLYLFRFYVRRKRAKENAARQEGATAAMHTLARALDRVNE